MTFPIAFKVEFKTVLVATVKLLFNIVAPVTPNPPKMSTVDLKVAEFETPSPELVKISIKDLFPEIDWGPVVIMPDDPEPADGKLNVCVDPDDSILKFVPFTPTANVCSADVNPFIEEIPLPELVTDNVIELEEFEIVIPNPTFNDLYSNEDEVLFIPKI